MQSRPSPGRLYVVATPIGNLEDVTLRALRILREARLIAAEDTRRTGKLLAHGGIDTPMISLHGHNETARVPQLLDRLRQGEDVALVTDAGTPLLSDPGEQLVRAALAASLAVEPIPGPSAVLAALAMSGMGGSRFTFMGFPPPKGAARTRWCEEAASLGHPVVFFEAPHRIRRTLDVLRIVAGDERGIAVCREMTKRHEQLIRGTLASVVQHPAILDPIGEFTCVLDSPDEGDSQSDAALDEEVAAEFYRLTDNQAFGRRQALAAVARRYQIRTRDVFAAVERQKPASSRP